MVSAPRFYVFCRMIQAASEGPGHLLRSIADFEYLSVFHKNVAGLTENELDIVFHAGIADLLDPVVKQRAGSQVVFTTCQHSYNLSGGKMPFWGSLSLFFVSFHNLIGRLCKADQLIKLSLSHGFFQSY